MQSINEDELKELIQQAKAEGKRVDDLEKMLSVIKSLPTQQPKMKKIKGQTGTIYIYY